MSPLVPSVVLRPQPQPSAIIGLTWSAPCAPAAAAFWPLRTVASKRCRVLPGSATSYSDTESESPHSDGASVYVAVCHMPSALHGGQTSHEP